MNDCRTNKLPLPETSAGYLLSRNVEEVLHTTVTSIITPSFPYAAK